MHKTIELQRALNLTPAPIYIDVRSPGEYKTGHIPGAFNLPLFSDTERQEIGRAYKQNSPDAARNIALAYLAPKLPALVSAIQELQTENKPLIIYCWRGGMRSQSLVTILQLMNIYAYQLIGGYKSYRQYVLTSLQTISLPAEIVLLCGSTGIGKTAILRKLDELGIPTIDLEQLANHRGSAFGHIGLSAPATAQIFDTLLLQKLKDLAHEPFIVVECESKRVGNVYIPDVLFQKMRSGRRILLSATLENRVQYLCKEYGANNGWENEQSFHEAIVRLTSKLGKNKTSRLLKLLTEKDFATVVHILLTDYYDVLYGYETANPAHYDLHVTVNDFDSAALQIIQYLHQLRK